MFGPVKMAPSILSADFLNLERDITPLATHGADFIHVDVMDGHFVPNLTIGPPFVKALKRITDTPLDVHLMIDNPVVQAPWYLDAGADLVTVHIETGDIDILIDMVHQAGARAGISLNPETPVDMLVSYIDRVDLILVMSVHPGFGGQSFIESSTDKVAQVVALAQAAGVNPLIEVDGGINIQTAPLVVAAGADMLVAGNAIFGADDPVSAMESIRSAGQEALRMDRGNRL